MSDSLQFRGSLVGHRNWVTAITTTYEQSNVLISASRDKKIFVWELTPDGENVGYARRSMGGHSECVQLLLEEKGNIDLEDDQGRTAAQIANANGHQTILELLEKEEFGEMDE